MGIPAIIAELKATRISEEASRKRHRYMKEECSAQAARCRGENHKEEWLQATLTVEDELG